MHAQVASIMNILDIIRVKTVLRAKFQCPVVQVLTVVHTFVSSGTTLMITHALVVQKVDTVILLEL